MVEYRCVVSMKYSSFVSASDIYSAKDLSLVNLGHEIIKNGLVNYIDDIECEPI